MRGIFMGKGDYNQDLYPTSILFECGTDRLSKEDAIIAVHSLLMLSSKCCGINKPDR